MEIVCRKCGNKFPAQKYINGKRKTFYKRKYCFNCSPLYGKNTRDLVRFPIDATERECPKCCVTKPISEFYKRKDGRPHGWCKECQKKAVNNRLIKLKKMAIEYKGGKCIRCGYNKYYGALEFHHLDPIKKEFTIAKARYSSFDKKMKNELDKCVLLCSNCHREEHGDVF